MYHVTIYMNDHTQSTVNSIGIELNFETAERIARDLNTAMAVLRTPAFAQVTREEEY